MSSKNGIEIFESMSLAFHMEASRPSYRARPLWQDFTSSFIPIKYLISVHMNRWAGLLCEISLEYWWDHGRQDDNFPMRTLHSGCREENVYIAHALIKNGYIAHALIENQHLSHFRYMSNFCRGKRAGNFSIWTQYEKSLAYRASPISWLAHLHMNRPWEARKLTVYTLKPYRQ